MDMQTLCLGFGLGAGMGFLFAFLVIKTREQHWRNRAIEAEDQPRFIVTLEEEVA